MAPPNNPNIARCVLVMSRDTRQIVNTLHMYRGGGWTPTDLVNVANALQTWFTNAYRHCFPSVYFLNQVQVRVYDPGGSPWSYDLNVSPPIAGDSAGTAEAANVTSTISWRAGYAGRAYRGRIYVPSAAEGNVSTDDRINSALVTLIAAAATNLLTSMPAGTVPVIFHRNDNLFSTILSAVVENIIDSQRRRLPGRGR